MLTLIVYSRLNALLDNPSQIMPDRNTNSRVWDNLTGIDKSRSHLTRNRSKSSTIDETFSPYSNTAATKAGNIGLTNELKQTRILLAESEKELRSLFKIYLDSLGADSETTDDGNKALAAYLHSRENGRNYDAVVLDTHLNDISGFDVAKKIRDRDQSQRIILITTRLKKQLPKDTLKASSIKENDILVMPFKLSNLAEALIH